MEKLTGSVNPGRIDLRTVSAVAVCRITRGLLRMLRRGGTSLPGRAAMAVQPSLLGTVSSGVETVLVTGTNGKTTTVGMLEQGLSEMGMDVLSNRSGANLLSGITAEYAAAADWRGRPTKLCAVVECDEGSLHLAVPLLHPRVIVVTNLFRDQLDRYGEVMHTLETIREGILKAPEAVLCLNADDSLTASLALDVPNPVLWYGLNTGPEETEADAGRSGREETEESGILPGREGVEKVLGQSDREEREEDGIQSGREETEDLDASCCIRCGTKYKYRYRTYAHLGSFYCPVCGYARREPDTAVTSIDRLSAFGTEIRLRVPGRPEEDIPLRIGVPALFNVYNAAAAVCAFFCTEEAEVYGV